MTAATRAVHVLLLAWLLTATALLVGFVLWLFGAPIAAGLVWTLIVAGVVELVGMVGIAAGMVVADKRRERVENARRWDKTLHEERP